MCDGQLLSRKLFTDNLTVENRRGKPRRYRPKYAGVGLFTARPDRGVETHSQTVRIRRRIPFGRTRIYRLALPGGSHLIPVR